MRFDPASLDQLDEPVRRYFTHALAPGSAPGDGVRLEMRGRIKLGAWLPFSATWEGDGRSFAWRAKAGPLRVVDQFARGAGSMDVRLLGRALVHADDADTARSGAGRAAVEAATWSPASLLPERGVRWRAQAEDHLVATWDVAPEQPEVHVRIAHDGAIRATWLDRWHGQGYVPCGGEAWADRRFGDVTIPSRLSAGWWYGTPRYAPFFEAEVLAVQVR